MYNQFGVSLRFGPKDFNRTFMKNLTKLPFGLLNVPTPAYMESNPAPIGKIGLIASDLMPAQTYAYIADDTSDKMKNQLCEKFSYTLQNAKNVGTKYIVMDLGFSDESIEIDPKTWLKRENMLRQLWMEAYRLDMQVLLPIRYPLQKNATARKMNYLIREMMCANLGLIADVKVHDIRQLPEVEKMFEQVIYDIKMVRLNWSVDDGNKILPQWLAPWKEWTMHANPSAPIIFEPVAHAQDTFILAIQEIAEMLDISTELVLK